MTAEIIDRKIANALDLLSLEQVQKRVFSAEKSITSTFEMLKSTMELLKMKFINSQVRTFTNVNIVVLQTFLQSLRTSVYAETALTQCTFLEKNFLTKMNKKLKRL
jgi:hypothetical protein